MILTRQYDLDVVPGGQPLIIRVSRYDTSSALVFSLFAATGALAVPSGATAVFRGKTGSGSAELSFSGSMPKVRVSLTADMTGTAGLIPFEIVLSSGAYRLVTATLYLDIRG